MGSKRRGLATGIISGFGNRLFSDFTRVWRILPGSLRRSVFWIFICILIQALLDVSSILSISFLALSVASPEKILELPPVGLLMKYFPTLQSLAQDTRDLALISAGLVALLIAVKNLMTAHVTVLTNRLGERIGLYVGEILFHQYLYSPYAWHLAGDSTKMFQGLQWRGSLVAMVISLMNVYTYMAVSFALCMTVVVCTPPVILLIMVLLALLATFVYRMMRGRTERASSERKEWGEKETRATLNAMRGIREILIYQQQPVFFAKFREASLGGLNSRVFLQLAPPVPTWILETAGFFVIFATIAVMIVLTNSSMGKITAVVTVIMLAAWRILPMLNRSLSALISIRAASAPALGCLDMLEKVTTNPAPDIVAPDPDFKFLHSIDLTDVSFGYARLPRSEATPETPPPDNTPKLQLEGISMSIPKGKRIGIIGRSGAGKTTLSLLLSGLAAPDSGRMSVDGRLLDEPRLMAYRRLVGFVPQNPYIMGGTIGENVAFCQWGKPWDEEKVLDACRMAEFDVAFKRGAASGLGQDGAGLSGGQAQRVAIARALYANPEILIFDEATSALDSGVEKSIMDTIFSLPREITTITIAHRLSTVQRCDLIFWLDDGKLVAWGTPDEILPRYEKFLLENPVKCDAA